MQDPAKVLIALGFFGMITISVRSIAGAIRSSFERKHAPPPLPYDDSRLDRIEQAIDSIAVEVERIAEVQRYTLKLEEERRAARLSRGSGEGAA